jgi:hypothetical protein
MSATATPKKFSVMGGDVVFRSMPTVRRRCLEISQQLTKVKAHLRKL